MYSGGASLGVYIVSRKAGDFQLRDVRHENLSLQSNGVRITRAARDIHFFSSPARGYI